MSKELVVRASRPLPSRTASRAAQYVRMSTDKQQYSIQNQAAVIAAYAHANNLQIVRTYPDEGQSGLRIKNRTGLQRLLADVSSGEADYGHVLVYDVSRWGRFQDIDESAHYEFICRQAGIKVQYCAEQFDNDGSMLSSIVKNLKRVMAAEYSRELSRKVHEGHCRLVHHGFHHGGPLSFGLSRELIDGNQQSKGRLRRGELKGLRTDRVRIRPGTKDEIAIVRWIFQQCIRKISNRKIARELNQQAVPTATGRPWKASLVSRILQNENYIGNIVFNRTSQKLGTRSVRNPAEMWIRGERCIEPIIDLADFEQVQRIIKDRWTHIPEDEMLTRLRRTLHKRGRLSIPIIDNTSGLPCADSYARHFGSLRNAYRLIGYTDGHNNEFIDAKEHWDKVTANLMQKVATTLERVGRQVVLDFSDDQVQIDGKVDVFFRVARSYPKPGHSTGSRVSQIRRTSSGWIVAIRLTDDNALVRDYLMIPAKGLAEKHRSNCLVLTDKSRGRLGFERFKTALALGKGIDRQILPKGGRKPPQRD